MAEIEVQKGHPRGLYLLFFTEMWERFSYYGMRALFILFLTKALVMTAEDASNIYGSYTGLVYLTPLIGGYLADKYWGNRKSIFLGGILITIGQFLMFLSASFFEQKELAITLMWVALTVLIVGNGFFKPNISTMVGQLYSKTDQRVDSAFTIFYMGINLGAFFSPLICGSLGDTGNPGDFKWGFLVACIGMIISVLSFELLKKKHLINSEGAAIGTEVKKSDLKVLFIVLGLIGGIFFLMNFKQIFKTDFDIILWFIVLSFIISPIAIMTDKSITKIERDRIIVIFILSFFVIFFWSAFEQAGASLTIFAEKNIDRDISFSINKWAILAMFTGIIFYLSKFFEWFFEWKKNIHIRISIIGFILFTILTFSGLIASVSFDTIPASWFQSVNPLVIITFALIVSWVWTKLGNKQPSSPTKMAIGLLLVCLGYIVIAVGVKGVDSTVKISMMWLLSLYFIHTLGELCLSPIGLSMVSKLAPVRFSSLLMGTWFLANALANKFAGTLSSLIPPTEAEKLIGLNYKSIIGFQITNLYEFFIIFIVMSGIASIILFFLSKRLMKMMHGVK